LKGFLDAVKYDDQLRFVDLRNNRFTKAMFLDSSLDFIDTLKRNESISNIDFRDNTGFDKEIKFRLSLIMLRNIDKLRGSGIMI